MALDNEAFGGELADFGGEIIIDRDMVLDLIADILTDRTWDDPRVTEFVDQKIDSLGKRKGLAPSSKELTALRKAIIERVK